MAMVKADAPAAAGIVTNQAYIIERNNDQSTFALFLSPLSSSSRAAWTHPENTILPTIQCVLDMGRPIFDASKTVIAELNSIEKPLKTVIEEEVIIKVNGNDHDVSKQFKHQW